MILCKWDDLPQNMRTEEVREYYDILSKKQISLLLKRLFDVVVSFVMLILLTPLFAIIAIFIKTDSPGPVFYRQVRVTQYGREFKIHKFRSMCDGADKKGSLVTVGDDSRITKVGKFIRKYRIDEFCQLIDVLEGTMTFVGVRPEVPKYVNSYTKKMMATLLLPAGVTNLTSIYYKDEAAILDSAKNADEVYIKEVLPEKMKWNLIGLKNFSLFSDLKLMFMTVFAVLGKEYEPKKSDEKKILFIEPYFDPEITADTHLENDLIVALNNAGYTVHVITPTPTRGVSKEVAEKYAKIKKEVKNNGKLIIERFWAPQEKKNPISRAVRYIYCNMRQFIMASRLEGISAIYGISTPPTQGLLLGAIKKSLSKKLNRDIPVVYYLEDIFPDSLVATGMTKRDSIVWKIGKIVESKTYKYATKIITISEEFKRNIISKNVDENKIEVICNWIDVEKVTNVSRSDNTIFDEYDLPRDKFYIVYAGNLGEAQNVGLILDTAKIVSEQEFVIFGSGGEEKLLKERIANEKITNVKMLPLQPLDRISEVYSLGDINIVICKKGFAGNALPSKTWSIMACSKPIVTSFDMGSHLTNLIQENQCGDIAEPDDAVSLAKAINRVYLLAEEDRVKMGERGRKYVEKERDRKTCTQEFVNQFNNLTIVK